VSLGLPKAKCLVNSQLQVVAVTGHRSPVLSTLAWHCVGRVVYKYFVSGAAVGIQYSSLVLPNDMMPLQENIGEIHKYFRAIRLFFCSILVDLHKTKDVAPQLQNGLIYNGEQMNIDSIRKALGIT